MSGIKNGKRPLSQKPTPVTHDEMFGSALDIPEDIKKEMKEKGLTPRWLNANKLKEQGGYNPKGWIVYKRPAGAPVSDFMGSDPSGVVRRGDMVLGYKTNEKVKEHRQFIQRRNDIQSSNQYKVESREAISSAKFEDEPGSEE